MELCIDVSRTNKLVKPIKPGGNGRATFVLIVAINGSGTGCSTLRGFLFWSVFRSLD